MKKYKVSIVSFGWVATSHMKTFTELPDFEPIAIMSRRKLNPAEIKTQYKVDVKIYNDYDEFLNDKNIDIVDIYNHISGLFLQQTNRLKQVSL